MRSAQAAQCYGSTKGCIDMAKLGWMRSRECGRAFMCHLSSTQWYLCGVPDSDVRSLDPETPGVDGHLQDCEAAHRF